MVLVRDLSDSLMDKKLLGKMNRSQKGNSSKDFVFVPRYVRDDLEMTKGD